MKVFFLFFVFFVGFVFLLRYLRKREVALFFESGMVGFQTFKLSNFQTFRQMHGDLKKPDPMITRAKTLAAIVPATAELKKG